MHSFLSRANAVAAYALSVLACLTFLCFLSTLFIDYRTEASINTIRTIVKSISNYNSDRKANDLGHITVDLRADLSPLFNWNVKQLFVYLYAEYETSSNSLNQVILWDKIIRRGENANLNFKNMNLKYYFWDDGNGLKGNKNITLTLSWNIIPNAGCLSHVNAVGQHSFSFPDEYTIAKQ
ncbi:hypothetical protein PGB90_004729 [Kerria lacca]